MRLIVIEENVTETVYPFEVKERGQMLVVDAEQKKLLPVIKNNFICNSNKIYLKFLYGTKDKKINSEKK